MKNRNDNVEFKYFSSRAACCRSVSANVARTLDGSERAPDVVADPIPRLIYFVEKIKKERFFFCLRNCNSESEYVLPDPSQTANRGAESGRTRSQYSYFFGHSLCYGVLRRTRPSGTPSVPCPKGRWSGRFRLFFLLGRDFFFEIIFAQTLTICCTP